MKVSTRERSERAARSSLFFSNNYRKFFEKKILPAEPKSFFVSFFRMKKGCKFLYFFFQEKTPSEGISLFLSLKKDVIELVQNCKCNLTI
jgi:hypothetical protein